jgi:ferredoxin-NADP reductase
MEMTVERLPDGEVSTFLTDQLRPGDELDVRGPIGGWFVWPGDIPALLVGGGSGVVPLTAMLRLARRNGTPNLVRMVVSVRSPDDLYYTDELPGPETTIVYTRHAPASEARRPGRSTARDLPPPPAGGLTFICGSSSIADAAGDLVVGSGTSIPDIRIERLAIGWPLPLTGWARRDFESPVRPGTFDGMNRRGSVTTGTGPPPPVRPALPLLVRRRRCRVGED